MKKFLLSLMLLVMFAPFALHADEIMVGNGIGTIYNQMDSISDGAMYPNTSDINSENQEQPGTPEVPTLAEDGKLVMYPGTDYTYTLQFTIIDGSNNCSVKCSEFPNGEINLELPSKVNIGGIEYTLTTIADYAFDGNSSYYYGGGFIGNLVIPNSVTTIGDYAFNYCIGLNGTLTLSENLEIIGKNAFEYCSFTGDLVIPNSVTTIGDNAFSSCSGFNGKLTLSENLETIGSYAFCYCSKFTGDLVIPNSVTTIGDYAFYNCSKFTGDLVIPNSVTTIGDNAFYGCSSFNGTLTLSENLETIGNYVFCNCSKFTGDLVIPNSVTTIGDNAFYGCSSFNGKLTLSENLETIGNYAFAGGNSSGFTTSMNFSGSLQIPNKVETIGYFAFYYCSGFNGTLIIPDGIEIIDQYTFYGCSGIESLILSNNVKSIGNNAFSYCTSLKSIISESITVPSATSNTFNGCSKLSNIFVPEEAIDTYSATSPWNKYTISAIPNITDYEVEVVDGENVLYSLVYNLADDGLNLEVKIGQAPASNVELVIPSTVDVNNSGYVLNVVSISDNAFKDDTQDGTGCELFTSITIPSTIEAVGANAFAGCVDVEEIISLAYLAPATGENCFDGITDAVLYVESYNKYNKSPWNTFDIKPYVKNYQYNANGYSLIFNMLSDLSGLEVKIGSAPTSNVTLNIPESISFDDFGITYNVVAIADNAFENCYYFTGDLVIPNSVTTIGDYAFSYCSGFNGTLTLSEKLETIGNYAFAGCNSSGSTISMNFSGSLQIPNKVETIGNYAFYRCYNFTGDLVIQNSVTTIGDYAFYGCSSFNGKLTLSENLETIGSNAFYNCSKFTGDLVIPNSVTIIGDHAFYGCSSFNGTLTLSENLETIGSYAFYNCSKFTGDLVIPNSVTTIGDNAFYSCSGFNGTLILSENLETIGNNAFYRCYNMKKMICYAIIPPAAQSNSFNGFSSSKKLYVPEESINEYRATSPWSSFTINAIPNLNNYELEVKEGDNVLYSLVFNITENNSGLEVKIGQAPISDVELTIPEKIEFNQDYIYDVIAIADNAFKDDTQDETGCELFTAINIPSKIKSIGDNAFAGCIGVKSISTEAIEAPSTGVNCFEGIDSTTKLYVDIDAMENYDIEPWNNFDLSVLAPITDYVYEVKDDNDNILYTLIFNTLSDLSGLEVKIGQAPTTSVELNIPENITFEEYNITYDVVSIADYAFFKYVNFVGDLVIPNSVTSIGYAAFYECWGFDGTLTLPSSLVTIGDFAFAGYESTMSFRGELIIPSSVTYIGTTAFQGCIGFTGNLVIPNGVTSIEDYAFNNCIGLNGTLTLSENLISIGKYAFYGCEFDGALVIPSKVTSIGSYAFQYCSNFDYMASVSLTPPSASSSSFYDTNISTLYVQAEAVNSYYNKSPWYNFNIMAAVPFISNLKEVTVSCSEEKYFNIEMFNCNLDDITSIKFEIFIDETLHKEFTWEGNIKSFGIENIETEVEVSVGTHELTVNVAEINGVEFGGSKTIEVVSEEVRHAYVEGETGTFVIDIMKYDNNNKYIYEFIDSDNSVIASGEINSSGILHTANVTVSAGDCVRFVIRRNTDNYYYNPTEGYYRIFDDKGNVVLFKEGEFAERASYLFSVNTDEDVVESYAQNTFVVNVATPGILSYMLATMAEQWGDVYILKVIGNINAEDMEVFYKLNNLAVLDLSQTNITNIGACNNLGKLKTVILPSTVTSIDEQAFYNCYSLKSINTTNVTTIGNSAFYNCYSLASIELPNVTTLGNNAFYYCFELTSIELPNVTTLGSGVFRYCEYLSNVTLSDNLNVIPSNCFYECNSLRQIDLPNSLISIADYAFYNCSLTDIVIPEGVTSIGYYTFRNCPLTNVSIPSTIENINDYSFYQCNYITEVYCYAIAPVITNTFGGGIVNATLHVPAVSVISYRLHDSWYKFENIVPIDQDIVDVNINSDFIIVDYEGFADEINLNINTSGHLTVSANTEFNVNNYKQISFNNEYSVYDNYTGDYKYYSPSTLINGTNMSANNVDITLKLRTNMWNFISFPFDVDVTDIEFPEGTLWVVRKYSGEDRANMSENTWHNVTDGMLLNAGEGYILHCIYDDYDYVDFTFKAIDNENKNNIFAHENVEQPLEVYPSEFAHNRSWNLVGNPYPSYFNTNGNIEHNGIITVWGETYDEWGYSNGSGYVAYSLLDDYYTLKPYESFFVQCPDDATSMLFKTEGRTHENDYGDYNKRTDAFKQRNSSNRKIYNFILSDENYSDRTRLVLNEAATVDYELSCDASKFMNDNNDVPQIYVFDNEIRYAINERPLGFGAMSIGVRIGQAGEYTLTLDSKEEYEQDVVLYDNITGDKIDILNETYTFFAEEGYDDNRFVLTITDNTVGLDENIILDINDSDVEVFDVFGRKVRVSDAKNGLYILRKGDKVQKCFINE